MSSLLVAHPSPFAQPLTFSRSPRAPTKRGFRQSVSHAAARAIGQIAYRVDFFASRTNGDEDGFAREILRWEPAVEIEDGLRRTLEYFRAALT